MVDDEAMEYADALWLCLQQSNVDSSGDIDAHGWDYANKTFIQHTLELGVEYTYD